MLSYRWFVLGVGFGCSDWQRYRVNNVGLHSALVSGLLSGGACPLRVVAQNPKISLLREIKFLSPDQFRPYCAKPPRMTIPP